MLARDVKHGATTRITEVPDFEGVFTGFNAPRAGHNVEKTCFLLGCHDNPPDPRSGPRATYM